MPVTDANGVTRTSVPYGTYTYTVTVNGVDHVAITDGDREGQHQHGHPVTNGLRGRPPTFPKPWW